MLFIFSWLFERNDAREGLDEDQGIGTFLIDRSLLESKEDQKSCQEEQMREG